MKKSWPLFFLVGIFFLLSYKNPFNAKSLIPNLEPYPDSLFYSFPDWNLIKGKAFRMSLNDISIQNIVPPSYTLYLLPFLALFRDIRVFYFANIVLSLVSIIFFYLIIKKIFKSDLSAFVLELILVTSYYFYSLPQFLMAENMSLTVFLLLIWFYLKPVSIKNIWVFSGLNIIFLLIKLSNVAVFASLELIFLLKVLETKDKKILVKFILISILVYGLGIGEILWSGVLKGREGFTGMVGFSMQYFKNNFEYYLRAIGGSNGRFIWMSEKFITIDLVILSIVGIGVGIIKKQEKLLFNLAILLMPLLIFMSFFYYPDSRYIYVAYPILIVPIAFILKIFKRKKYLFIFLVFLAIVDLGLVSVKNSFEPRIVTLKKQIGLNFRHAEEPWNYLAVQNFNNYFSQKTGKRYLATFLPIFYVDYFKNGNYEYLPISDNQEFPEYIRKMCPDGVDECYQKILKNGGEIYLSRYYLSNNMGEWGKELDKISQKYKLTKVVDGCFGTCDIYRLDSYQIKNKK